MIRAAFLLALCLGTTSATRPLDVRVERYDNGQVKFVRTYRDGKEEGAHYGWWPDGTAKFVYQYHDGLAEGSQREWYSDGNPFTEFNYRHGHELGQQRMWTAYGELRANYVVKDGRRFGSPGSMGCRDRDSSEVRK